tara:strand:- start:1586 stop:2011 length:426 start_codon:yes stop_codon:yes gene_type:complete
MAFNQDESTYTEHGRRIPRPSHNFVPEYQQSGIPHVKEETLTNEASDKFTFDSVTRWIVISNPTGNDAIKIGFNKTGVEASNFFQIEAGSTTPRLEIKCKELHIVGTNTQKVHIIAGLTSVAAEDFPDQKKENGFTGVEAP